MEERFYITGLGNQKIILGFPWLKKHNPQINWKTGNITWEINNEFSKRYAWESQLQEEWIKTQTKLNQQPNIIKEVDPQEQDNQTLHPTLTEDTTLEYLGMDNKVWINAKMTSATDLAAAANLKKPELTPEEIVPKEYHKFLDVFDKENANHFPEPQPYDHKIEIKLGFQPKAYKGYNLTLEEQIELDKFLKKNLDKGYIKPLESPMASPFFFVKKKDRKLRPCQDYCYLNDWTVKNTYPLPLISKIMDKIKGAKFFTKFDIRWGYNNIWIRKEDQWKATFKTNQGLFKPTVMFFRMCNSPATFQAIMDHTFINMIEGNLVIIYMDNILIFTKTQEELERITKMVLQQLQDNDLCLKPKKCKFDKTIIEYLGLIVKEGQLSMDPVKLKGITGWLTPSTVKQLWTFLGFGNFYRQFIQKFSEIAMPRKMCHLNGH